jgi:hypothetical protein
MEEHANIYVTGLLRFDRYRQVANQMFQKSPVVIVLLSFRLGYGISSEHVFYETLTVLLNLPAEKFKVIIKAKDRDDKVAIQKRCSKRKHAKDNNEILCDVRLEDIFSVASVIVGSQSLSTIEALYSSAPILIPDCVGISWSMLERKSCIDSGCTFYSGGKDLQVNLHQLEKRGWPAILCGGRKSRKLLVSNYLV